MRCQRRHKQRSVQRYTRGRYADAMSLMQCRTRTALELSGTRRLADDRYYYSWQHLSAWVA